MMVPPLAPRDIVVIPDLHGRLDALEAMLRATGFVDAQGRLKDTALWLVQLGDLLDRGPNPRACVQRMMDLQAKAPERVHVVRGNHEEMALKADSDPMVRRIWLINGGPSTLADYEGEFEPWLQPGGKHYEWLRSLPIYFEYKNVLFCHAGLAKSRRGKLDAEGLMWDRPPLEKGAYRAVVCGHTVTASGQVEESKGVWSCDIGLGHHRPETAFQVLVLTVGDADLLSKVITI
jgi:serine/threonine protein phosphatase 1